VSADPIDELRDHLEQCCFEYVADINGRGEWVVYPKHAGPVGDDRRYDVDQDIDQGPVVLVRRSDGARLNVDVSVSVWDVS
jgi:hypothetical protein